MPAASASPAAARPQTLHLLQGQSMARLALHGVLVPGEPQHAETAGSGFVGGRNSPGLLWLSAAHLAAGGRDRGAALGGCPGPRRTSPTLPRHRLPSPAIAFRPKEQSSVVAPIAPQHAKAEAAVEPVSHSSFAESDGGLDSAPRVGVGSPRVPERLPVPWCGLPSPHRARERSCPSNLTWPLRRGQYS
jgi:hypothetical protein